MSFTKFPELAPELRFKIWDEALRQEMKDRLILVHCDGMRVIPHPSARSLAMNANHASRNHARTFYYDVKLKVWTAEVGGLSVPSEIIEFAKTSSGRPYTRDTYPRRSGHGRPRRQGWIFVSSQHDRFALAGTTRTDNPSWNGNSIGLCEKAFLRDYLCGPTREAMQAPVGLPSPTTLQCDGVASKFQARHIADRLPQPVQTRIRHVVCLRDQYRLRISGIIRHDCGPSEFNAGSWNLNTFKGACFLYTGYIDTIPAGKNLGPNKLVEWKKSEMDNGRLIFICLCKSTRTCANAVDYDDDAAAKLKEALEGEDTEQQISTGINEVLDH